MTPSQKAVIESPEKRLLVLATSGSGKTESLVGRVCKFVQDGCDPAKMAIISYTVASSGELQKRLTANLGDVKFFCCGTLHSFCSKILSDAGKRVTVLSENETMALIGEVIAETRYKGARKALDAILIKGPGYFDPQPNRPLGSHEACALAVWQRMSKNSLVSYDALLYRGLKWLRANQLELSALYVDEFQDAAPIDLLIYQAIDAEYKTYVGDFDQNIFGFRHSSTDHIEKFVKRYGKELKCQ